MKIAIIADVLGQENNGTTITVKRLIDNLKKRGHDVDTSVYTVQQALDALRACKAKGGAR